jgi:pyruvate dehydrogenase E1 component alpha subunit
MIPTEQLLKIYRRMLRIRAFETRARELVAAGEIPDAATLTMGLEATVVGACATLSDGDLVIGCRRAPALLLARDVPMSRLMAELFGRDTGTNRGRAGATRASFPERGVFNADGELGVLLATGAALAARVQGGERTAMAFFGADSETTRSLQDGMALAAAFALPVIYVHENDLQRDGSATDTGRDDVAERAERFGIHAVSVDGSDVLAVYTAVDEAVRGARSGAGATLVEARAYPWGGPPGASPKESREMPEPADWMDHDPIGRFIVYLAAHGVTDEPELARIAREVDTELFEAVEFARSSPPPSAEEALADIYEGMR